MLYLHALPVCSGGGGALLTAASLRKLLHRRQGQVLGPFDLTFLKFVPADFSLKE